MPEPVASTDLIINPDGSIYHLHLRPEDVAPVVFTVGDPERVRKVSRYFDEVTHEVRHREFLTHTGRMGGQEVMVASTGMGTPNIEIFMLEIDALLNIDFKTRIPRENRKSIRVIRLGTSGAIKKDIPVGSVLISSGAVGMDGLCDFYPGAGTEHPLCDQLRDAYELHFTPYFQTGDETLIHQFSNFRQGITLTTPGFYAPQGRRLSDHSGREIVHRLGEIRGLTNMEMETSAYYALGRWLGHQMLSVNAILANRITDEFSTDPDAVVDQMIRTVLEQIIHG